MAITPSNVPEFRVRSHAPELGIGFLSFDTDGNGDPTTILDPSKVVESIAHDDTGSYVITFRTKWKRVRALNVNTLATTDFTWTNDARVEGTSAQSQLSLTLNVAGSAADVDNGTVDVSYLYSTRDQPA